MRVFASIIIAAAIASAASAQVPDFTPQTPLIGALLHDDAAEAERLLKGGADPNEGVFFGLPPVILAVVRQNPELVRMMAARGANLDTRDRTGATALMWAAFNETDDAGIVARKTQDRRRYSRPPSFVLCPASVVFQGRAPNIASSSVHLRTRIIAGAFRPGEFLSSSGSPWQDSSPY